MQDQQLTEYNKIMSKETVSQVFDRENIVQRKEAAAKFISNPNLRGLRLGGLNPRDRVVTLRVSAKKKNWPKERYFQTFNVKVESFGEAITKLEELIAKVRDANDRPSAAITWNVIDEALLIVSGVKVAEVKYNNRSTLPGWLVYGYDHVLGEMKSDVVIYDDAAYNAVRKDADDNRAKICDKVTANVNTVADMVEEIFQSACEEVPEQSKMLFIVKRLPDGEKAAQQLIKNATVLQVNCTVPDFEGFGFECHMVLNSSGVKSMDPVYLDEDLANTSLKLMVTLRGRSNVWPDNYLRGDDYNFARSSAAATQLAEFYQFMKILQEKLQSGMKAMVKTVEVTITTGSY